MTVIMADEPPEHDAQHGPFCYACSEPISRQALGFPLWAKDGSYAVLVLRGHDARADDPGRVYIAVPIVGEVDSATGDVTMYAAAGRGPAEAGAPETNAA